MEEQKTSTLSNGLIWFGAAISIAEILTGTYLAPLGFGRAMLAVVIGHIIGGLLMYFAGIIGANTEKSSMETVKISFGEKGSLLFSSLNVLQLVGWTAIMIVSGAAAANCALALGAEWIWSLIIGALIAVWILIGIKNLGRINTVAMSALFILTVVIAVVVFRGGEGAQALTGDGMTFGAAVELSVAMPLSWLPLIADYTRSAKKKKQATLVSTAVYGAGSCWMYAIGLGAAVFTGESDIAQIMVQAGLGIAGLLVIVFSTVTTTFLDAYSAGVSSVSIFSRINEKWAALAVCAVGTALAVFMPVTQYEDFLYLIGSVFAPMTAVLFADYFILHRDMSGKAFDWINIVLWGAGFAIYRIFMNIDTPLGSTLPVMIAVMLLCVIVRRALSALKKA